MRFSLRKLLQIALFNLMLVAFIGVILRYKIAYSLPFVNQKNLLHGHSHFAFSGWITQVLMALLVADLSETSEENYFNKYRWILYANLLTGYGMFFSFPFQGYGAVSIVFSTLSIFVSYIFAVSYWKDMNRLPGIHASHPWFKVALLGNVISSIGPFSLAYMMASRNIHQNWYLASIYFFLHFQYNIWFLFTCLGLLVGRLSKLIISWSSLKWMFQFFAIASLPTFFLSVLWWPIPEWLYSVVVIAAVFQLIGWIIFIRFIKKNKKEIKKHIPLFSAILFLFSGIAFSIKLCLQAGSVIPSLSRLAFGFRPVVIGYLHLVLLGVITIFIISFIVAYQMISVNKWCRTGISVFITGIFLNELLLMIQGVSDLQYEGVPYINVFLLFAAVILFSGMFIMVFGQIFRKDDLNHKSYERIS